MAIYPYFSTTIINKDVLTNSSFKAGMALIMNSNGMAIKADSQSLVFDSVYQKYGRFLGFAASDHDISGNTIIIPDVIGSNYIDSNYNFIKSENTEYSVPKRSLLDYQDSAISNFYNATDLNPISKRGIGVYNTPGDYFVTDQFNPVLHGDYGVDSTTTTTLNPGDLLTFGGGVNAGKLVKVNVDSFGPEIMVVGQVFRHLPSTGLLYFRQVNYRLSFGTNNLTLLYDFGNPASYSSGTTVYDLSPNGKNGLLQNGPVFTNDGVSSYLTFDKTNDVIETNTLSTGFGIYNQSFTLVAACSPSVNVGDNMIFGDGAAGFRIALHAGFRNTQIHFGFYGADTWREIGVQPNNNYYIVWRYNLGGSSHIFYNGSHAIATNSPQGAYINNTNYIGISRSFGQANGAFGGKIYMLKIYNRALTDTEVTNMYNLEKSRYGL